MKQYLISSVFSLSLISLAQAADLSVEEQCQALGYNTKISDCEKAGSAALVCPLNDGDTDMSICITDSCRGYPLFKENGKFYYLNKNGEKSEARPLSGALEDYIDGDFETCVSGYGANKITYYRVPKCKNKSFYNDYYCDEGCDMKKYPYSDSTHMGTIVGDLKKCVMDGVAYFGYETCRNGWVGGWSGPSKDGTCVLNNCDVFTYPYKSNPNVFENRGDLEECKIGAASFYRYKQCANSNYILKGNICVKKCQISCNNNATEKHFTLKGDKGAETDIPYGDWQCKVITPNCRIGDIAVLQDKEIGVIVEMSSDKTLLMSRDLTKPINLLNGSNAKLWSNGSTNCSYVLDADRETSGKFVTKGLAKCSGYFPAAEFVNQNAFVADCPHDMCKVGQWFLPSYDEVMSIVDAQFILYNVFATGSFLTTVWASSERGSGSGYAVYLRAGSLDDGSWSYSRRFYPMLSF